MDYITINGQNLPYPDNFNMKRAPNIVAQIRTMTGKDIADINGWKWADTSITWKSLYPEDLTRLINAVQSTTSFTITFLDAGGTSRTVNAVLKGFGHSKSLVKTHGGHYVWQNISIDVMFPDCYSY
jgi:hypothetical protein